jgi:FKBP-type peptidyl-prolyl cis-trans isomerase 2
MKQAKIGDTVSVHYTGKFEDGTVFDTSINSDPMQFTIGEGQVIPGFEQAVTGMNPGESKTAKIQADQAYGPHYEEMMMVVNRDRVPVDLKPEVGQQLQASQSDGQTIIFMVTNASESSITLDANHPLAGKDLNFDIQLMEIL